MQQMPESTLDVVAELRNRLKQGQATLQDAYLKTGNAAHLLKGRTDLVDGILCDLWSRLKMPSGLALVAVGGYGRGELYPASDIDLLLLVPEKFDPVIEPRLEALVGLFWDIGLDVGHSVRSPLQCLEEAELDITVQTALLEARHLTGSRTLFAELGTHLAAATDPLIFLKAKRLEQDERYARHNDTPYSLEPNCKESPGGLRDLQIIMWATRACGLGRDWRDIAAQGLITAEEARQLARTEDFLCHLRIHLHLLVGRCEDRLLFDYQEDIAKALNISSTETRRASEVLMQRYYRNAKLVTQLNTLVVQNLVAGLSPQRNEKPRIIDDQFQAFGELLDVREEDLFQRQPQAILRSFLVMQQHHELKGMTARTLRSLWQLRRNINPEFRRQPENRALFIQLFQQKHLLHELRRMNQYSILGNYLPAFGRIVGQLQHDLYHVYTVDQHIMQVIRNLRRFAQEEFAHEYPFCTRLMTAFKDHWLLYIAALFHDIAKGRGGDHSKLGKADAHRFCRAHGLNNEQTELIEFLVQSHLTMSAIAQKQDLSDPDIIEAFATTVKTERRLTALYLLTVADIRGTSPKVWNVWKGKLLEDLYRVTLLRLQGKAPLEMTGLSEKQGEARSLLRYHGLEIDVEKPLWKHLDTAYFMRHDAEEISWHTRRLYYRPSGSEPVIRARINPIGEGLQVMIYTPDQPALFARLCGYFAKLGYSIFDAKIHTTRHGYALDSFVLFGLQEHLPYRDMIALIEHDLAELLKNPPPLEAPVRGRVSRQVRNFPVQPEVEIRADERGSRYLMSITASDHPGLLFAVAKTLSRHGIAVQTAKIATLGERVEDSFLITGDALAKTSTLVRLEQDLLEALQV
ncbi:MAG: [protein-PII] uridylyltransferase [Georgfuchsia sp.]